MRACLLLCAALALAPSRPRAAASPHPPAAPPPHPPAPAPQPARLEHIKTQILTKLGLSTRPTPLGAPPRDVVRQILARAADPGPERPQEPEHSMREIIAIAHRGFCEHRNCRIDDSCLWISSRVISSDEIENANIIVRHYPSTAEHRSRSMKVKTTDPSPLAINADM